MCTSSATESTRSLIVALLSFCIFRPKAMLSYSVMCGNTA